jgi:hypothetical protein
MAIPVNFNAPLFCPFNHIERDTRHHSPQAQTLQLTARSRNQAFDKHTRYHCIDQDQRLEALKVDEERVKMVVIKVWEG